MANYSYSPLVGKKPVTTMDPIQAAQQLRIILHSLTVIAEGGGEDDGEDHYDEDGELIDPPENPTPQPWIDEYTRDCILSYGSIRQRENINFLKDPLTAVEIALKERKTKPGLEALTRVRSRLQSMEKNADSCRGYIESMNTQPIGGLELNAERLRKAYELAQCLPTEKDIPTDPAENTLRAIVALLRHHNWPGVEGITQPGMKEVTSDGTQGIGLDQALTEAATSLQAIDKTLTEATA